MVSEINKTLIATSYGNTLTKKIGGRLIVKTFIFGVRKYKGMIGRLYN